MMYVGGTEPYPWPYDGILDSRRLALLIVGAQRRWASGVVAGEVVEVVLDRLVAVATAVRGAGGIVVRLRHSAPGGRVRRGHSGLSVADEPLADPAADL
jgi:hypothetical protein